MAAMCQLKVCGACRQSLPVDEFNFKDRARGVLQSKCKACTRAYAAEHYRVNKQVYVDKASVHRNKAVARNKAYVHSLLQGQCCHRCESGKDLLFYRDARDGSQRVHDAVYAGLSLSALDEAVARSKVWCSACLQQHTISYALAARDVRSLGGVYTSQTGKANDYRRRAS
jgi:hypothetical protein